MKVLISFQRRAWLPVLVLAGIILLPHSGLSAPGPGITTQPQGQTNGPGTDVSFTVAASGAGTLAYQWTFNGGNLINSAHINGATSATLTISNVVFSDAGIYQVVVNNSHDSVTSSNALLGVQRVIAWGYNDHGQSTVPVETSNAVAVAGADSSDVLRPDGTVLGWGNTDYTPTNPPATLSNVVSIVADGAQWGMLAVLRDSSVVTWGATPQPPADLSNVLDVAGSDINTITHGLALKNDGTLVEWDYDGYITNGVAAGLSNIVSVAAGVQHFLALRADGTVVSWGGNTYGETNVPAGLNQVVQVAGGYGWSLALKSNGDLTGWGTDYYNILATAASVHNVYQIACPAISALALFNDGSISAWGNNVWGSLNVPPGMNSVMAIGPDYLHGLAILGGRNPPQIYQPPAGLTAAARQSVLFKAAAVGNVPLRYQWRFNGTNIAGATAATLLLTNVQPAQAGLYSVVLTNLHGSVQSSNALLAVAPLRFIRNPESQVALAGANVTFNVETTQFLPVAYQWQFNGLDLPGETNASLTLANVQTNNAGSYTVRAGNTYGALTSAPANLSVLLTSALLDMDFGDFYPVTSKTGPAATGQTGSDFWNSGRWPFYPDNIFRQLKLADGRETQVSLTASNFPYAQTGNGSTDPMYAKSILSSQNGPGSLTISNLPPGIYDFFMYSDFGKFQLTVGEMDYGQKISQESPVINPPVWEEGRQYVRYRNVVVTNPLTPPVISVRWDYGYPRIAGIQIAQFTPGLLRPAIWLQPTNQSVPSGSDFALRATATGLPAPGYQWFLNGAPVTNNARISGATSNVLTVANTLATERGDYVLVVSNVAGSVTSSVASVWVGPAITQQPADQQVVISSNATFAITADGSAPLNYQWLLNGVPLTNDNHVSGATTSSLTLSNVLANSGPYSVVVSNTVGSITSSNAYLYLLYPAGIVVQPQSQTNYTGGGCVLSVTASGTPPFGYQWFFNDTPLTDGGQIGGTQTPALSVSNLGTNDSGSYRVVVTNAYGATTSLVATVTVLFAPPVFDQSPQTQTNIAGNPVTLSGHAIGSLPMAYQWFFNGTPLTNETATTLLLPSVQTNQAGNYWLAATNPAGFTNSAVATLTVLTPPAITLQPTNQTWIAGLNASLVSDAAGSEPLTYQWYRGTTKLADDTRLTGTAGKNLSISNVLTSDAGNYTVVVTNLAGMATSSVAVVTVLVPPSVTLQPVGRSSPLGMTNMFSAAAAGATPLAYQWRLNGADIPGATNTSYAIAAVETNDLGVYQFVASNAVGVAVSSNALLTLGPVAAWGYNYYNQCLPPPGLSNVTSIAGGNYYSLASLADGSVAAWGNVGTYTNSSFTNVVAVAASIGGALALRSDGSAVGSGTINPLTYKVYPSNVVAVAAGYSHGLALRAEGTVVTWGSAGPTAYIPIAVPYGLSKVTGIAAGYNFSMALRNDGTVAAWGAGAATNVPAGLSNVVAIAAGSMHGLALKSDGTLVAWGSGAGTNIPAGLSNVMAIAAANYFDQRSDVNFAVKSNGTVLAWGLSPYNQTNVPTGLSNVVAVVGGAYHTLALVNDGSPQILQQPAGGTAWSGSDWALRVSAAGTAPLRYQWQFNGTDLPDATNATLLLPAIQAGSAGNYRVTVSNSLGTATSFPVPLTVMDSAPFILTSPAPTNRPYIGSRFSLSAAAGGSGPMRFQWQLNGQDIADATDADWVLDRVRWTNGGNYTFIASNSFGTVTSSIAKLFPQSVAAWGSTIYGVTNIPLTLSNAVAVALNGENAAALRADGTIAVWGQMGTVVPATISNVMQVAPSTSFCLTLRTDGTVGSWNISSGLSNSLAGLSNIVAMEADSFAGTFLRPDGTVIRISGSGTTNFYPQLTNVVALSKFYDGFAALRADGTVFTSGSGTVPPATATSNVLDIAMERTYGGALKRDGSIQTWGVFYAPTNMTNLTAVCANAGVRDNGTIAPWVWTPNSPALANVPAGLANVGAVDGSSTAVLALLVARDFPPLLLPEALNTTALVVSSRGSPQWFGQTYISHDGNSAAQSAAIGNNTASSMRLWIGGPITVSFWWKVSSASNHGILSFSAGGIMLTNISGEMGWQQCTVDVPAGNQILQWTYAKDGEPAVGQDAGWVDQLQLIPQPPVISMQPASQSVVGPTNVVLNVGISGTPPLTYRWWKDGGLIPGAGASSLTLPNAVRTNSGIYWLVITNVAGNITSSNAVLDVRVPQLLGAPSLAANGKLLLSSADVSGGQLSPADLANFEAQASTNLVEWTTLTNGLSLTNGMLLLQDADATNNPARFYRIIEH